LHALVLDEADQMLDMGFVNDVKKIVKLTQKTDKHSFSATMPIAIRELAEMFFKIQTVTVSPVSSTAENVEQHVYFVENRKRNLSLNQESRPV
jgi:ATP-dependent RNA helicase RhlE